MAYLERGTRVGRSQAVGIFWGLVSTFFAAAACYYFWKFHENETITNVLRDQSLTLQDQIETLNSQKNQLQSSIGDEESQLKAKEDFLQDKEAKLADEESQLNAMGTQKASDSALSRSQAAMISKFNDAVHKLVKDPDTDVVVRGGRPVLRVPSSVFFDYGEWTLKPEGKTMLKKIAQALDGQLDNFELRVEVYTDVGGEGVAPGAADSFQSSLTPPADPSGNTDSADQKPPNPGWQLTGRRAGVLAHFIRDQTAFPFQNVLVVARGDYAPIIDAGSDNHARNRRVEITLAPLPPTFHPIDTNTPEQANATPKAGSGGTAKPEHKKTVQKVPLKFGDKDKKKPSPDDHADDAGSSPTKSVSARQSGDASSNTAP